MEDYRQNLKNAKAVLRMQKRNVFKQKIVDRGIKFLEKRGERNQKAIQCLKGIKQKLNTDFANSVLLFGIYTMPILMHKAGIEN